ncbi:MAG TPA: hypothetical protein VHV55_16785 [Pirellulales bacterium]|nr:hypothetical protein [Pirellulales bacterium]
MFFGQLAQLEHLIRDRLTVLVSRLGVLAENFVQQQPRFGRLAARCIPLEFFEPRVFGAGRLARVLLCVALILGGEFVERNGSFAAVLQPQADVRPLHLDQFGLSFKAARSRGPCSVLGNCQSFRNTQHDHEGMHGDRPHCQAPIKK